MAHVIDQVDRLGPGGVLRGARVMVTGGAGFIGGHLVTRLLGAGAHINVIDDLSTGHAENLRDALHVGLTEADVHVCDIRTRAASELIKRWRPHVLVHLAAQTSVPAAAQSPLRDADVNIRGTVNILDACVEAGVGHVVYAASSAVYGQVTGDLLPVREGMTIAPVGPYGLSKATALHYLNWYRSSRELPYTALILGNVYGPRRAGDDAGVVAQMAGAIRLGRRPVIFGDGRQTRDFVFVHDVVDAAVLACATSGIGTVNIASGVETSVAEVLRLIGDAGCLSIHPQYEPAPPGDVRRMVLDIGRAGRALGWRPATAIADGVAAVLRAQWRSLHAEVVAP
jgi:UDP-glucose 4-epimerase